MTDEQLDQLMRRVEAGDDEAQALIDEWIEQALGPAIPAGETGARGGTRTRTLLQAAAPQWAGRREARASLFDEAEALAADPRDAGGYQR